VSFCWWIQIAFGMLSLFLFYLVLMILDLYSPGFLVSFISLLLSFIFVYFAGRVNGWCCSLGNDGRICLVTLAWIACSEVSCIYKNSRFFPSRALRICFLSRDLDLSLFISLLKRTLTWTKSWISPWVLVIDSNISQQ